MRFITEFELVPPAIPPRIIAYKEYGGQLIGSEITDLFGWDAKPIEGKVRYTIEIEAFPMDKWIEFKKELFMRLSKGGVSKMQMSEMIKELESFGAEDNKQL